MAQKLESKQERPLQTHYVKQFMAVNTVASRVSEPQEGCFYDLTNAQPIGYANLHSIRDASAPLHDFGDSRVYADFSVNLKDQGGVNHELLLIATTDGKLWAYLVGSDPVQVWKIGDNLSKGDGSLDIAQYDTQHALIIDSTGYYRYSDALGYVHTRPPSWQPATIVPISQEPPGTPSANAAPTKGSAIAVYGNRVWIADGRRIYYSGAGTSDNPAPQPPGFDDFTWGTGSYGGGWEQIDDQTLRGDIKALFAANGYLYVFGETSIDAISDVTTTSSSTGTAPNIITTTVTNYTRLNISPTIGTDYVESIISYGRLIFFMNKTGIWLLAGFTVQLVSTDVQNSYYSGIDGTIQYLDWNHYNDAVQWVNNPGAWVDWQNSSSAGVQWQLDNYTPFLFRPSGGQTLSNNQWCAAFNVVRKNDPIMGSGNFIIMYWGDASGGSGKWWFVDETQDIGPITHVCPSFINYAPVLFCYIGNQLYQLFADPTSSPSARIMTPLWDFNDPIADKQALRAGVRTSMVAPQNPAMQVNIDTLTGSFPIKMGDIGSIDWVNATEQPAGWKGVTWQSLRNFMTYWGKTPECFSKCLGFTVRTVRGTQFELNMFALDYKVGARWVGD